MPIKRIMIMVMVFLLLVRSAKANNENAGEVRQALSEQHINVSMQRKSVSDTIASIAWSPDSQCIATFNAAGNQYGHLRVFNTRCSIVLDTHVAPLCYGLKFSPSSDHLAYVTNSVGNSQADTVIYDCRTGELIARGTDLNSKYPWTTGQPADKFVKVLTKFPQDECNYRSANGCVMCIRYNQHNNNETLNLYKGGSGKPIWSYTLKSPSGFSNFISNTPIDWDGGPAAGCVVDFKWSPDGSYFALSYQRGIDKEFWLGGPMMVGDSH